MACKYLAPIHYLNECGYIVYFTANNKSQWNFNQNTAIFNQVNTFYNTICKMLAISRRLFHFRTQEIMKIMNPALQIVLLIIAFLSAI